MYEERHARESSAGRRPCRRTIGPLVAPIYQSVKFSFDDVGETLRYLRGEREGFFYSRTRTRRCANWNFARADAGQGGLPAGRFRRRQHCGHSCCRCASKAIMYSRSSSRTVRRATSCNICSPGTGLTHTLLSIEDLPGIERVLRESPTRLVIFESPTNPVTKIADIAHLTGRRPSCRRAHRHGQHLRRFPQPRRL